jgi:molecular chaperone GrpE
VSDDVKNSNTPESAGVDLETLKQQLEKAKNDYLYLRAEFDTFRRNAVKERSELLKYGSERLALEILSVLDNFERALDLKVTESSFGDFLKGVELNTSALKSSLSKFGIQKIQCDNQPFDPSQHEALGSEESSEVSEGKILKVLRCGYKLHDRLIRPAQVIIAKAPVVN